MKHFTVQLHSKQGAFLRFIGFDAENKTDLEKQIATYNKNHPEEYVARKTAYVLKNDFVR